MELIIFLIQSPGALLFPFLGGWGELGKQDIICIESSLYHSKYVHLEQVNPMAH